MKCRYLSEFRRFVFAYPFALHDHLYSFYWILIPTQSTSDAKPIYLIILLSVWYSQDIYQGLYIIRSFNIRIKCFSHEGAILNYEKQTDIHKTNNTFDHANFKFIMAACFLFLANDHIIFIILLIINVSSNFAVLTSYS